MLAKEFFGKCHNFLKEEVLNNIEHITNGNNIGYHCYTDECCLEGFLKKNNIFDINTTNIDEIEDYPITIINSKFINTDGDLIENKIWEGVINFSISEYYPIKELDSSDGLYKAYIIIFDKVEIVSEKRYSTDITGKVIEYSDEDKYLFNKGKK